MVLQIIPLLETENLIPVLDATAIDVWCASRRLYGGVRKLDVSMTASETSAFLFLKTNEFPFYHHCFENYFNIKNQRNIRLQKYIAINISKIKRLILEQNERKYICPCSQITMFSLNNRSAIPPFFDSFVHSQVYAI